MNLAALTFIDLVKLRTQIDLELALRSWWAITTIVVVSLGVAIYLWRIR